MGHWLLPGNQMLVNPFPHTTYLQQTPLKNLLKIWKIYRNEGVITEKGLKTLWQMEKLLVLSKFSFCQCFQKLSAADASKCIYRWKRVNPSPYWTWTLKITENLYKWKYNYWIEFKTLWQMEKLLFINYFSIFKGLLQCHQKVSVFGKWLRTKFIQILCV